MTMPSSGGTVSAAPGVSTRSRLRRWGEFVSRFPDLAEMNALDLGGTTAFWEAAPVRPGSLTMLNMTHQACPWASTYSVVGDACDPPAAARGHGPYDLVIANSVIGHVGGHYRRQAFADTVRGFADHHWVQTPYRYFPLDAFFLFPGLMSLPAAMRAQVSLHWPFGTRRAKTHREAVGLVLGVEFLSKTELRYYFPESDIWPERLAGFTKSIVAVR
jgi:hypothetical protein